ncbi:MAG: phage baseplate assembly protein V [Gammaproteobacteria bacterium]|nr:phage baseplate assembly protein V [Gammaproteobacteria bacterium]
MNANTHLIAGMQLAEVVDTNDPQSRGRIQVRLTANNLEIWSMVMVAGAGNDYGVSCLPKEGELVVVAFLDSEQPVVMGALWKASDDQPQDAQPVEENYLIRTPGGSELRMNDESPSLEIKTQAGYRVLIDESAGEIKIERDSQSITLTASSIDINSSGSVNINASTIKLSASMVDIQAGMTSSTGVIQCSTLISTSVVSSSYTPGAGNIW